MKQLFVATIATLMALAPGLAAAQTQGTGQDEVPPAPQQNTAPVQQTAPQQQGTVPVQQNPPVQQVVVVDQGSVQQQQLAPTSEPESRPRIGLVISGAVLFGVSWIIHAALVSPFAGWSIDYGDDPQWNDFRIMGAIPLAGPWIQLAIKPTAPFEDSWATYLLVDGLLQAAGITMLILGLTLRKEVGGYANNESPSFMIGPMLGQGAGGLTATGRF